MLNINELKYDKDGLIPAVVTDVDTGAVLMLAYMNAESLRISIGEGSTCFWSRSRKELWRKGQTSGNTQHIISIKTDCDRDSLVVTVKKDGPACHTGAESCFFEDVYEGARKNAHENKHGYEQGGAHVDDREDKGYEQGVTPGDKNANPTKDTTAPFSLETLYRIIEDRKINAKPGSYTTYLFEKGVDKMLKKLGEESTEVIIAGKSGDKAETVYEIADLAYHAMVLMAQMGKRPAT